MRLIHRTSQQQSTQNMRLLAAGLVLFWASNLTSAASPPLLSASPFKVRVAAMNFRRFVASKLHAQFGQDTIIS